MNVGHYPHLTIEGYYIVADGPLLAGKHPAIFLNLFPYLYETYGKADVSGHMNLSAAWPTSQYPAPFTVDYQYYRAYFADNQERTIDQYAGEQGWKFSWKNPTARNFLVFVEVRSPQRFVLAQGQVTSPVFNVVAVGVDPDAEPYPDADEIPAIYYTGGWVVGATDSTDHLKVLPRLADSDLPNPQAGRFALCLEWKRWFPDVTNPRQQLQVLKLVDTTWSEVSPVQFQGDRVEITDRDFTAYALARVNS